MTKDSTTTDLDASGGDLWDNPLGTDGFEFIEYAAPEPEKLAALFEQMGFRAISRQGSATPGV